MVKKLITRIGRCSNGRPLEIDMNIQVKDLGAALDINDLDEQIDMLCVVEFTIHKRLVSNATQTEDEHCLNITFDYLNKKREENIFSHRLDQMGLRTSIDRVRHGQKRAL